MTESPQNLSLRTHGRSFYWARHLLGALHAERATRLYAFCREVDDLADEGESKAESVRRLQAVIDAIERGYITEPWLLDAMLLFKEARIARWVPLELVRGVLWDLKSGCIRDEAELLQYSFRVAGTVGIMMSGLLDVRNPRALRHAVDLGVGMQLTNMARDVVRDGAMGRRYLPGDWVDHREPQSLVAPSPARKEELKGVVRRLLLSAEPYYQSGFAGLSYLPGQARLGILVAGQVYREIGVELLKSGGDCWERHVVVESSRKAALTAQALVSPFVNPSFWRSPITHDERLHRHLQLFPIAEGLDF